MSLTIETKVDFSIQNVQTIVAKTVNYITIAMVQAVINGHKDKLTIEGLRVKHTVNFAEELSLTDQKTMRVYLKLFNATYENIQKNSIPLQQVLIQIIKENGNRYLPAEQFLGSFVLPLTKTMMAELEQKEPGAIDCEEIWTAK
jgi:hypothetical protein